MQNNIPTEQRIASGLFELGYEIKAAKKRAKVILASINESIESGSDEDRVLGGIIVRHPETNEPMGLPGFPLSAKAQEQLDMARWLEEFSAFGKKAKGNALVVFSNVTCLDMAKAFKDGKGAILNALDDAENRSLGPLCKFLAKMGGSEIAHLIALALAHLDANKIEEYVNAMGGLLMISNLENIEDES